MKQALFFHLFINKLKTDGSLKLYEGPRVPFVRERARDVTQGSISSRGVQRTPDQ